MKNKFRIILYGFILYWATNLISAQNKMEYFTCFNPPCVDIVHGDLTGDGLLDSISITYNSDITNDISISLFVRNKDVCSCYDSVLTSNIYLEGIAHTSKFIVVNGLLVFEISDYQEREVQQLAYKFNNDLKKMFLYKWTYVDFEEYDVGMIDNFQWVYSGPKASDLNGNWLDEENLLTVIAEKEQAKILNSFKGIHNQCLAEFKSKVFSIIPNIKKEKLVEYCESVEINNSTVFLFNDLAYFIIEYNIQNNQINDQFYFSITILENILYRYPHRSVALLNIGDAYWYSKNKNLSQKAYQKYIKLMKASGKECKIPKRVFERIKE